MAEWRRDLEPEEEVLPPASPDPPA
jgi:hypothetical protein